VSCFTLVLAQVGNGSAEAETGTAEALSSVSVIGQVTERTQDNFENIQESHPLIQTHQVN